MSKEEFCGKLESPCGNDPWGWCQSCPKHSKSSAANKAAEEGGLPEPSRESRIECALRLIIEADDAQALDQDLIEAGRSALAIAADRTSRQVANKAEVECRDDGRCQYAIDHGAEGLGHCPIGKCCMPATPPATTGASTAREAVLDEVIAALTKRFVVKDEPWVAIGIVRALKGSVGASTVLTDERIDSSAAGVSKAQALLPKLHSMFNRLRNPSNIRVKSEEDSRTIGDASELCRTVINAYGKQAAAQAGQVAVPEDWPTPDMVDAGGAAVRRGYSGSWRDDRKPDEMLCSYIFRHMLAAAPSPAKESK